LKSLRKSRKCNICNRRNTCDRRNTATSATSATGATLATGPSLAMAVKLCRLWKAQHNMRIYGAVYTRLATAATKVCPGSTQAAWDLARWPWRRQWTSLEHFPLLIGLQRPPPFCEFHLSGERAGWDSLDQRRRAVGARAPIFEDPVYG
jgi:hypothetical protein